MSEQEAFEKWYKEKYYKYDLYPKYAQFRKEMKEVWQAATAESDKHIAELNAENKQIDAINSSLQTHINVLREALEKVKYADDSAYYVCEKIAIKALVATPAQSLQAHDNEVIERVVTLLKDWALADGIIDMRVDDLIEDVRKLKD